MRSSMNSKMAKLTTELTANDTSSTGSTGSSRSARRNRSRKRRLLSSVPHDVYDKVGPFSCMTNRDPDPFFVDFMDERYPEIAAVLQEYSLRPADTRALYDHLRKYAPLEACELPSIKACALAFQFLDELVPDNIEPTPLLSVKVNKIAGPGLFYREIGYFSKEDAEEEILEDCVNALNAFREGKFVAPRYYRAGGRARLARSDVEVSKRGRMIQSQDGRDVRLCQMVGQSFTSTISNLGVFAFGSSHFHGYARTTSAQYTGCCEVWAFDVTGMDRSLNCETDVNMMLNFILQKMNINAHFKQFIIDTIMRRALAMPDGTVFLMKTGLASGHALTSLIETLLVSWLCYAVFADLLLLSGLGEQRVLGLLDVLVIEILGDDGRIGITPSVRRYVCWDDFRNRFEELFAGKLRPTKCEVRVYPNLFSVGHCLPAFLGKEYYYFSEDYVKVFRSVDETLSIRYWPERPVHTALESYVKTCGLVIDNPHCECSQALLREYCGYLMREYQFTEADVEQQDWDDDTRRAVFMEWAGVPFPVEAPRLLTQAELDDLYDSELLGSELLIAFW